MMIRTAKVDALHTQIKQLRYAVATTSCRVTAVVLEAMLREAELRFQGAGR